MNAKLVEQTEAAASTAGMNLPCEGAELRDGAGAVNEQSAPEKALLPIHFEPSPNVSVILARRQAGHETSAKQCASEGFRFCGINE